ncbi:MAG: hypothetical protein PG977_000177 [Bartonella clarridgeiae]|nr:hypothetical protein [Bartonella clarridgeiae]WCR54784.1 MAG: hypothetical protein PG977_000177 [Bartonella clarridgeiae]
MKHIFVILVVLFLVFNAIYQQVSFQCILVRHERIAGYDIRVMLVM